MSVDYGKVARELGAQTALEKEAGLLSGAWAGAKALGKGVQSIFGRAGKGLVKAVEPHSAGTAKFLQGAGHGASKDMMLFGGFGAGLGALGDSENRMRGAMKGFLGGAAGGLGWRAGGNLLRRGQAKVLSKTLDPKSLQSAYKTKARRLFDPKATNLPKGEKGPGLWERARFTGPNATMTGTEAMKTVGTRAALGTLPLTAAFAGSEMLASPFHEGGGAAPTQPQQQFYQPQHGYGGYSGGSYGGYNRRGY